LVKAAVQYYAISAEIRIADARSPSLRFSMAMISERA